MVHPFIGSPPAGGERKSTVSFFGLCRVVAGAHFLWVFGAIGFGVRAGGTWVLFWVLAGVPYGV